MVSVKSFAKAKGISPGYSLISMVGLKTKEPKNITAAREIMQAFAAMVITLPMQ
jgi:hypothetical protein